MTKSCTAWVFGLFAFASQLSAAPRPLCPTIYDPTTCTYGEFSADGSNPCVARNELINLLEGQHVKYDPAAINCGGSDGPLSSSAEGDIAE